MGIIYMIHIPSGKKYIGQHKTNNLKKRKKTHYQSYKAFIKQKLNNTKSTGCIALYNAFSKYSIKKCIWTLLENNIPLDQLNDKENDYIMEFDTLSPNGYNLKLNDSSKHQMFSNETLKKMSKSQSKVYDTKLNRYRRNKKELNDMPKHINFIRRGNRRGYRIVDHPNCKLKDFLSSSIPLNELKQKTLEFLKQCEINSHISTMKIKIDKGIPKGILEKPIGYEVQFSYNKKRYSRCFTKSKFSNEENLLLAIQWLNKKKIELKTPPKIIKEEGSETK